MRTTINLSMTTIFLSYRRTDGPQACRVYDWLVQRFGNDAVFMDVAAIPFAVDFPDFIRQAIASSKVLIALIGTQWLAKIHQVDDPVRTEIELAIANNVPVLPVLIGNTPMPNADELPASISSIAFQNATTVGVLHDFNTHMRLLLPKIESILGSLATQSVVTSDPALIRNCCETICRYLLEQSYETEYDAINYQVIGASELPYKGGLPSVTLFLHRVARFAEVIELHFILSFWAYNASDEQREAGWVMQQLERTPLIPDEFFVADTMAPECDLKIRRSDEDPRQIWKIITDEPLRLSLAYIATVSPKTPD